MEAKLENLEGLKRKYTFALKWEDINAQVGERLKKQQRKAKVQGFRPGKAPMKMVESMYGPAIQEEVINDNVGRVFYQSITKEDIKVVGYPSFEAEKEQTNKDELIVSATFEVLPEVVVGNLSEREIEQAVCDVGEEQVEETINILRKQRTRFERVEREAKDGDRVIVDFAGTVDGVAFDGGTSQNFPFVIGEGRMLPDFEKGVLGMKEGESKNVEVAFPEDYHSKDLAGKTAVFEIKVNNVAEAVLPEVNEEFAKSLGIADGDVAKMRAEISKNVTREVKRRVKEITKENAMQALLDVTSFEVPAVMVQDEALTMRDEMIQNFTQQGMDPKHLGQIPTTMFEEQAKRRVSLRLIVTQTIRDNELTATDEQVRALVEEFADSYEDPKEVIDWYFSDEKNLQGPRSLVLEENVVQFVLGKAKVLEKQMSFEELMNPKQQAQ